MHSAILQIYSFLILFIKFQLKIKCGITVEVYGSNPIILIFQL